MHAASPHTLALLLWCGLVALKLTGLALRWRGTGGERLGRAFERERRRRALAAVAGAAGAAELGR